ncbi:hypothetical protein [Streptomyces sp. NPDC001020]
MSTTVAVFAEHPAQGERRAAPVHLATSAACVAQAHVAQAQSAADG